MSEITVIHDGPRGTYAKHMASATAAALPPELPPADLRSRLRQSPPGGGEKGLTTGPCDE
jgi:hypothetical protein